MLINTGAFSHILLWFFVRVFVGHFSSYGRSTDVLKPGFFCWWTPNFCWWTWWDFLRFIAASNAAFYMFLCSWTYINLVKSPFLAGWITTFLSEASPADSSCSPMGWKSMDAMAPHSRYRYYCGWEKITMIMVYTMVYQWYRYQWYRYHNIYI